MAQLQPASENPLKTNRIVTKGLKQPVLVMFVSPCNPNYENKQERKKKKQRRNLDHSKAMNLFKAIIGKSVLIKTIK